MNEAASGPQAERSLGTLTGLRLSRLRAPRWHLRLADHERAALRPLRTPGLRQPLPAHARPSGAAHVGLATAGEADRRGPRRGPRLDLSWLAPRTACGATRRARCRPSGAARPRRRAAAGSARRPLRELQRAQGVEPAAAVRRAQELHQSHRPVADGGGQERSSASIWAIHASRVGTTGRTNAMPK